MKLQILRTHIINAVSNVCSIAKSGKSDHILENVMMGIKEGFLFFAANDASKQLTAKVQVSDLAFEAGEAFLVNAKKLHSIIKAAPEEANITIQRKDNDCIVRYGRSRFKLRALEPKGDHAFPIMGCNDIRAGFFVQPSEFKTQLSACDYAMGKNDVRHYLNGMYIEMDNGMVTYVASNGHVLAKSAHEVKGKGEKTSVILPNDSVKYLEKITPLMGNEPVKVLFNHVTLKVESNEYIFIGKLVDGKYPDVQRVIPKSNQNKAVVNTQAIVDSIQRASVVGAKSLQLNFNKDGLVVRSGADNTDESIQEVDAQYVGNDQSMNVNTDYLSGTLHALSGLSEQVEICFNGATDAFLINAAGVPASNRTHVVMPMRV